VLCADEVKKDNEYSRKPQLAPLIFFGPAAAMGRRGSFGGRCGGTPAGKVEKNAGKLFPEGVASGDPDHHSVNSMDPRVTDPAVDKLYVEGRGG